MRMILVAVLLVVVGCGADDGGDPFVGDFDVRWSGVDAPDIDGAHMFVATGGQFDYAIDWTRNGSVMATAACNIDGDCLACIETFLGDMKAPHLCPADSGLAGDVSQGTMSWPATLTPK